MITDRRAPLCDLVLEAWRTNARVTEEFVGALPAALWASPFPETPRRTIRWVAAHLHNARCRWTRTLGQEHGIRPPALVDPRTVTRSQLVAALRRSSRGIAALLEMGCERGGTIPPSRRYVWRNLALDVAHVLTYFVAHEAHHRGQIVMVARQLNHRLPASATAALWQWRKRPKR